MEIKEKILKSWSYAHSGGGNGMLESTLTVTERRIIVEEKSHQGFSRNEISLNSVAGVETSYNWQRKGGFGVLLFFSILFLIAAVAAFLLKNTLLSIVPASLEQVKSMLTIAVGGLLAVLGLIFFFIAMSCRKKRRRVVIMIKVIPLVENTIVSRSGIVRKNERCDGYIAVEINEEAEEMAKEVGDYVSAYGSFYKTEENVKEEPPKTSYTVVSAQTVPVTKE